MIELINIVLSLKFATKRLRVLKIVTRSNLDFD